MVQNRFKGRYSSCREGALKKTGHSEVLQIRRSIPADGPIYFVSDLHLGDGTRSDAFMGKDEAFLEFLRMVDQQEAHLVIVGDAIDFHQAWSFTRVLRAHSQLLGELSRLSDQSRLTYIWGNHDYELSLFRDLLRFEVCSYLQVGDNIQVQHGYEYDPYIGPHLEQSHLATRIHHL
ncbi:MAG: metallophosphoesterase, partial [Myxococcota bacterium]|nr:metallophosphoesterase [Myxococcota bacterium]